MISCHVCLAMSFRKPALKKDGPSITCILCNRPYCQKHKACDLLKKDEDVCEINHITYYGKYVDMYPQGAIFPTLGARVKADACEEI